MVKLYTVLQFEDDSRAYVETTRFVESRTDNESQTTLYRTAIGAQVGKLNTFEWADTRKEAIENHKLAIDFMVGDDDDQYDDECGGCECECEDFIDDPMEFLPSDEDEKEEPIYEYEKVAPKCETANPEVEEEEKPTMSAKSIDDIVTIFSKTGVKNMDFKTTSTMVDGVYSNTICGEIDGDKFESVMKFNQAKDEASIVMKINDEIALEMEGSMEELRDDIFKVATALLETR